MWRLLVSLVLLAGDAFGQANSVIDSDTDLLALPSDQHIHSSVELLALENFDSFLPFGHRLPGYEKPTFSYSYTINNDPKLNRFSQSNFARITDDSGDSSASEGIDLFEGDKVTKFEQNMDRLIQNEDNSASLSFNLHEFIRQNSNLDYSPPSKDFTSSQKITQDYLPPQKIQQSYLPPQESKLDLDYLPPSKNFTSSQKITQDYLLPQKIQQSYIPPQESKLSLDYLPPSENFTSSQKITQEYLPPQKIQQSYLPPPDLDTGYIPPDTEKENKTAIKKELPAIDYLPPSSQVPKEKIHEKTFELPNDYLPPLKEITLTPSKFVPTPVKINYFASTRPVNPVEEKIHITTEKPALELNYLVPPVQLTLPASVMPQKAQPAIIKPAFEQKPPEQSWILSSSIDKAIESGGYLPPIKGKESNEEIITSNSENLFSKPHVVTSEIRDQGIEAVSQKKHAVPLSLHGENVNQKIRKQSEITLQKPYGLVGEHEDLKIEALAGRSKLQPYALVSEIENQDIHPRKQHSHAKPYALVGEIKDQQIHAREREQTIKPFRIIIDTINQGIHPTVDVSKSRPYGLVVDNTKQRIHVQSEDSFVKPYGLLSEIKNQNIHSKSEVSHSKPFGIVADIKNQKIHVRAEESKLEPYAIISEIENQKIHPRKQASEYRPYGLVGDIEHLKIHPKTQHSKLKPYAIVSEIKNQEISPKLDKSQNKPYGLVSEVKDVKIQALSERSPSLPQALLSEIRDQKIHTRSHHHHDRQTSSDSLLQAYEPGQYESSILAKQSEKYASSPFELGGRIVNQPIIPQSDRTSSALSVSSTGGEITVAPNRIQQGAQFGVYSEKYFECRKNSECRESEVCQDGFCTNGCSIASGVCIGNAECETRHHIPACICPSSFTARTIRMPNGQTKFDCMEMKMPNVQHRIQTSAVSSRYTPFSYSNPIRRQHSFAPAPPRQTFVQSFRPGGAISSSGGNACHPSPCGDNTRCETNPRGIALCRCIEDYVPIGNTINGCKPQCVSDQECPDDYRCTRNKCERVCVSGACGLNAECDARNHRSVCSCPRGYHGSPESRCIREPPVFHEPVDLVVDPCNPSPCGDNADCRARGEQPVCSCPRGSEGDPLTRCIQGECIVHTDCPNHRACQNLRCIDPCVGVCGSGAECTVRTHQPVCSCPRNYIGDPFRSCRALTEYDICNPTPCGRSTNCKVRHDGGGSMRAVCSCIDNYLGDPLSECRPECVRDTDCAQNQHCEDNRCRNPCVDGCGDGAYCDVRNHRAVCTCPEFFKGDPHSRCFPECTTHEGCRDFEACYQFECIDPCVGACGTGADCKVDKHTPICSCPRDYTGDPFVSCRRFTLDDLCNPNPCGTSADCTPGTDREGNNRPVCTCPRGYIGNPLVSCQRGDCEDHNQCPNHQACYAYLCTSPCYHDTGSVCGDNARCTVKNHQPVCSCPRGYNGDPRESCRVSPNARHAGRTN